MKSKILLSAVIMCLVTGLLPISAYASTGTKITESPYQIQMNSQSGSYSQNASYATSNGFGLWTQVNTYSTVAYDLSQITTITYSGTYSNVSVSGGTLSQNDTSCMLWLIDADTSDELFSATLNTDKSEGTVDLSGANQTKDLSNVIIKMRSITGGYSSKGTVYCYSTLPQYIAVEGTLTPIFSGNLTYIINIF